MSDGSNVIPFENWAKPSAVFKESPIDPSRFTAGIGMAWPVLTLKGKSWGWRFRGIDHTYTAPNPAAGGAIMAVQFLDVVLVDAGQRISKVYYKTGFKENERTPPTCWSADGITPDNAAAEKQSATCGGCRHNVFGSSIGPAGQRGKECSDNKRLAVVPVSDLANTDFGGPFMLRLPPGSFSNYTSYVSVMASRGFHAHMIVTRLMFDPSVSHPKVTFNPVRPLNDAEASLVVVHQKNPRTNEMLNDKSVAAFADDGAAEVDKPVVGTLPPADVAPAASGWGGTVPPPVATAPEEPKLTPEQQEIAKLKAQLAAAEKPEPEPEPEPEPKVVLTPEQLEIQQLKAKLAEAEAAKKKPGRPRSKPVAPPVTPMGNGASPDPAATPSAVGNAISDRIADLVGKTPA